MSEWSDLSDEELENRLIRRGVDPQTATNLVDDLRLEEESGAAPDVSELISELLG